MSAADGYSGKFDENFTVKVSTQKSGVDGMNVLYLDVDCLKNHDLFEEKFQEMSSQRKEKILSYKYDSDKRLSLGAGILLDEGLKTLGYRQEKLTYSVNKQGKPYYKELPEFCFNLSHSGHYAVAVFSDMPVGIDIEEKKFDKMRLGIAKRFFHEKEYSLLKNVDDKREQMELFYRIWTWKESFVKAAGGGMSIAFKSFCTLPSEVVSLQGDVIKNIGEGNLPMKNAFFIETEQMGRVYFKYCDEIEGYGLAVCSKKDEKVDWIEIQI